MKRLIGAIVIAVAVFAFAVPAFASGASQVPDDIWVNGQLFGTVVTPTSLPVQGPFEPIYDFSQSGLAGQHSIAPAGPGDPGFFGGRWTVFAASYTAAGLAHFNDGSGSVNQQLKSTADLQAAINAGYVTVTQTDVKFVCTLIPSH